MLVFYFGFEILHSPRYSIFCCNALIFMGSVKNNLLSLELISHRPLSVAWADLLERILSGSFLYVFSTNQN